MAAEAYYQPYDQVTDGSGSGETTLEDILEACRRKGELLSEGTLILLARDMLTELAALQQDGSVHGVLTPAAIVLRDHARFTLADTRGPAKARASRPMPGRRIETDVYGIGFPYLAPETFFRLESSSASNVFVLGIILWECHLGQHPFQYREDESVEEVVHHICYDPPLLPAGLAGQTSGRGVLALASVMLIKDPARRPSAGQLLGSVRAMGPESRVLPASDEPQAVLPAGHERLASSELGGQEDEDSRGAAQLGNHSDQRV